MKVFQHLVPYCFNVLLQFSVLCSLVTADQNAPLLSDTSTVNDELEYIHLRWRTLGEGVVYHFQMSTDRDFTHILVDKRCDRPTITIPYPRTSGQYYVRTKPIFPNGKEGMFSLPQKYKIRSELPPPLIIAPREIEEYRGIFDITMKWKNVPRASGYHVMLARDRHFQDIIQNSEEISGTFFIVRSLDFGTYFLKISTIARDGTEGEFSPIRPFIVAPPRPAQRIQ